MVATRLNQCTAYQRLDRGEFDTVQEGVEVGGFNQVTLTVRFCGTHRETATSLTYGQAKSNAFK